MSSDRRAAIAGRAFVTLGALLPYWRFLTFNVIYITDDFFASDIFNGEFPGRVLIGQLLRHGQLPVWTSQLCSGLPLAGSPADPIGLAAFSLLPPAAALDLFVIVLLLVAAHGTYSLARRVGASSAGAVLAGIAFAGSGYVACQLKHLAIVSTVVWLPVGMTLLDRALDAAAASRQRATTIALFGIVFAEQSLCGFPQSVYICGLVYAAFALFKALSGARSRDWGARMRSLSAVALATALGAATGAVVLLPLAALGAVSDRADAPGWEWASRLAYWPPNAITFVIPYFHGSISDNSYVGPPFFWEDYGYVGAATFLLAIYGAVREWRRPDVRFIVATTLVAYLLVLGPATPVYHVAYLLVPGMKMFRFPTRFLIVVELGIAVLGAVGLTNVTAAIHRLPRFSSRAARAVAFAVCGITACDLFVHQPRQNPIVSARTWLSMPDTARLIRRETAQPRTFTPRHRDIHRRVFDEADGWSNVEPYFALRDVLEPNTGGALWNTPSADCYAGISARWYVDVWGDHNREASVMAALARPNFEAHALALHPVIANLLRTYGVTHVLSPYAQQGAPLAFVGQTAHAFVYRVADASRVRVVAAARRVASDREAVTHLLDAGFNPNREIELHDVSETIHPSIDDSSPDNGPFLNRASIVYEDSRQLVVDVDSGADAFLLVADTYYPGWTARIDGTATPVYRANISVRAVRLRKGHHEVRFTYDPPGFFAGLWLSTVAGGALLTWAAVALYRGRRARW